MASDAARSPSPRIPDWDEIEPGQEVPAFVRTTDLAHWNRYAAINDEFIPIHMDPAAARAAGQKDVFGMGNLRISYLHNALHAWLGGAGDIVDFECQFRGMNYKGDALTSTGTVTGKEERDGRRLVHLDLHVVNQDAKDTAPGKATLLLFRDGKGEVLPDPPGLEPSGQAKPGSLLDQATIDRIGESTAATEALPIGANDMRRWAIATHYPEPAPPELVDEDAAARGPWGGLVSPREFNPFAWTAHQPYGGPWLRGMGTEPGTRVLNGGQRSLYFEPLRAGDRIRAVRRLADVYEKQGSLGTMLFFVSESRWTNQRGALVRLGYQTSIYY